MTAKKSLDLDSIMVGIEEYLNETDGDVEVNIVDDGEGAGEVEPLFGGKSGGTLAEVKDTVGQADEEMAPALKEGLEVEQRSTGGQGKKEDTELLVETPEPAKKLSEPKREALVAPVAEGRGDKTDIVVQEKAEELEERTTPALKKEGTPSGEAVSGEDVSVPLVKQKGTEKAEQVVQDEADELEAEEETTAPPALKNEPPVAPVVLKGTEKAEQVVQDEADELEAGEETSAPPALKKEPSVAAVVQKSTEKAEQAVQDETDELEPKEESAAFPTLKDEAQMPPVKQESKDEVEKVVQDEADELEAEQETAASPTLKDEAQVPPVEQEPAKHEANELDAEQKETLSTDKKKPSAAPVQQDHKDASATPATEQHHELKAEQETTPSAETREPVVAPAKQDAVPSGPLKVNPPVPAEKKLASEQASSTGEAPAAPAEKKLEGQVNSAEKERKEAHELRAEQKTSSPLLEDHTGEVQQKSKPAVTEPGSILDRDTHELLQELEALDDTDLDKIAAQLQLDEDRALKDAPLYIYTSLAGGGFHMVPRTNRLATILTAHRAQFQYRDLGTDAEARAVWKRLAHGKQLPGLVRGDSSVIGNWEEVEELNEEFRLREML